MNDMNADFIGGPLAGQKRSPISEAELCTLGYKVALKTHPVGNELMNCCAVPVEWAPEKAHRKVKEHFANLSGHSKGSR
ncbi:hypothetical protein [Hydrogenophaga soli]